MVCLLEVKGQDAPGGTDHLLATHRSPVGFQPAAPKARHLVGEVADVGVLMTGQHQIGLERVVAVFDVGWRRILVGSGACRPGRRSRVGGLRLEAIAMGIDLVEESFEVLLDRDQHEVADAGEIFAAQFVGHQPALVETEADRNRVILVEAFELGQAILMISRASSRDWRSIRPSCTRTALAMSCSTFSAGSIVEIGPAPAAQGSPRKHRARARRTGAAGAWPGWRAARPGCDPGRRLSKTDPSESNRD